MSSKKRRHEIRPRASAPARTLNELHRVEALMEDGEWSEAREILEDLNRRYPGREDVNSLLINVAYELKDMHLYERACEEMARLRPEDPIYVSMLAGAYMTNFRMAMAIEAFRYLLERWPNHERAKEAREALQQLEKVLREEVKKEGLSWEEGFEIGLLNDEINMLLEQGHYEEMRKVAQELLERYPHYAPALNNVSQSYYLDGDLEKAIETAQSVLEFDPDNIHALSNLARYTYLQGRAEDSRRYAERMQASRASAFDRATKMAEALSYMGDYQGVLDTFRTVERDIKRGKDIPQPILYHLAAVASWRLGNEREAKRLWRDTLHIAPGFDLAEENLADLAQEPALRHGPWPYPFPNWIPPAVIRDLSALLKPTTRKTSDEQIKEAVRTFLQKHPELETIVPLLLDRGDRQGREFALLFARTWNTPEMQAALRDFALSRWGPDSMRLEALQFVQEAGLIAPGPVRMWLNGEWADVQFFNYEFHDEPQHNHGPQVERLLQRAAELLHEERAVEAESLLKEALEIEPDAADILNNLAVAYSIQKRYDETQALISQIHERYPDYLFARINLASQHARQGRLKEARELLEPILSRRRMHVSEFASLCIAQIEILLAEGEREGAQKWLEMWEQVYPDHSALFSFQIRVRGESLLKNLFKGRTPSPDKNL